jgi:hypothetical protein
MKIKSRNQSFSSLLSKGSVSFFVFFIAVFFSAVFVAKDSIFAQIATIYNEKTDQIAGINALMSAVSNNDIEGVRFFSKAGGALINQKNYGGATSLHIACREKNFDIATILVKSGADVNAVDNEGWTPLMRASLAGSAEIVNLLLDNGAKASAFNSIGESAIIHATSSDCDECLKAMFKKFNFMSQMDVALLKEQISNAFIVAKNRDNKIEASLLEGYLDRVVKMLPLVQGSEPTQINEIAINNSINKAQQKSSKKLFKLISPNGSSTIFTEDKNPVTFQQPTPVQSQNFGTLNEKSLSDTLAIKKKFKFICGPSAAKANIIQKSEPMIVEKKEVIKITTDSSSPKARVFKFYKTLDRNNSTEQQTKQNKINIHEN